MNLLNLIPYYRKYHEMLGQRDHYKALAETWMNQCLAMQPPDPPEIVGLLSVNEIIELYVECFPSIMPDLNYHMLVLDGTYQLTTMDEVRRFVEWDNTNLFKYVPDILDCDDFAAHLWGAFAIPGWSGLPVALVVGGGHAFCSVVALGEDGEPHIHFIEPQTDFEIAYETMEGQPVRWIMFH